ncbi:MAG: hypothetical protein ABDH28_04355 [Brevinematia bacterium]
MSVVDLGKITFSFRLKENMLLVRYWQPNAKRAKFFNAIEEGTENRVTLEKVEAKKNVEISGTKILKILTKNVEKTEETNIIGHTIYSYNDVISYELDGGAYSSAKILAVPITGHAKFKIQKDGTYILKFGGGSLKYADATVMFNIRKGKIRIVRPKQIVVQDFQHIKAPIKKKIKLILSQDTKERIISAVKRAQKILQILSKLNDNEYIKSHVQKEVEALNIEDMIVSIEIDQDKKMVYLSNKNSLSGNIITDKTLLAEWIPDTEKHIESFMRRTAKLIAEELRKIVKFERNRRNKIIQLLKGAC